MTDSTKSGATFLVLVRGIFFLYHLKAYLNGFILSHDSKFLGAPFMAIKLILSQFYVFFGFKANLGHERETQKFRVVAQNKAIQISFQMI